MLSQQQRSGIKHTKGQNNEFSAGLLMRLKLIELLIEDSFELFTSLLSDVLCRRILSVICSVASRT